MSSQTVRLLALVAISIWLATTISAVAQSGPCQLVADDRNPPEQILRCGDTLVVRTAHGTVYHPITQKGTGEPTALQVDSGAVMIEFHPSAAHKNFQILTPHAIAAVRGTKWAVEVKPAVTSTLVLSGKVAVKRLRAQQTVVLGPGEGVDVSAGTDLLVVKRWAEPRVRALLERFGE